MNTSADRDAAQYASRLASHAPVVMAYWDRDQRCRYANRAYETWLGVEPDRLIGSAMRDVLGPRFFAAVEAQVDAVLRGMPQTFERTVAGPDGMPRHTLANYTPDVVDGQVAGFFVTVTDVGLVKSGAASLPGLVHSLTGDVESSLGTVASLVEAQESLAITLASIHAGFIATDRQGRVSRINAVAARLLALSEHDALGASLWNVFVREDRDPTLLTRNPVDVMIERNITMGEAHHVVAVARDGTRKQVEVKAALTRAADGTVSGMAMVLRDLSAQLMALVASNSMAAIVESSHDAIIGKTLDGRITSWNAAAQAIFGYRPEEAIGQPVTMLIPADRLDEEMRILADLARGVKVMPFDTVRRTKDGRAIDISVTISPIRDADGRIAGASKIARDITRQRAAESALRASQARLRFTLSSAQIGDWELDLASLAIRRSLQHDRCFGYETLQPSWSLHTLLRHTHAEDRDAVVAAFDAALATRVDWRVEFRVLWPDRSVHWVALHGSLGQDADPPTRMSGIISDITQRKQSDEARRMAERLEAENRQIQEATRLKSQFLANMSHELRTPLNAIIGFADLLHSGAVRPDSPKHHLFLGHIATSGRHLLQLINDVLDLSKVESGKFEFFPEPVDLAALVKDVNDILQTTIDRKHIKLSSDIDASLTDLVLDPARLKQVLYNYLSNAIKFSAERGSVVVRARAEGPAHVRIEVEDSGIGIAPDQLSRLFTEFQQLDTGYSKQHEGTGLGLALTRRLVEAQGGSVGVQSEPGLGSVFHVVLNRVHGSDLARRAAVEARTVADAGRHMLVVEDDRLVQSRLVRALLRAGYHVQAADTGERALHLARDKGFDAMTLDLMLPDSGGLSLLARIRDEGPSSGSPVVALTVAGNAGAAASFAIEDILGKPLRNEELLAAMARFRLPEPGRANVMVIDDDPLALDLMRATLKAIGIDSVCLQDGRQALQEMATHRPDAIILDLMMPDFDGFAVLDALQRLPEWRETPVYIWTSMILTDEEYASLARSARAILGKGGGALAAMLERLRRWRPRVPALPPEAPA